MLPGCCSGHSPSEYASPHTFPSNLIKWLSDLSFSLVLLNWHCFLVKFCRWLAHVFLLRAEPAGHLRWNMREPCKFLGLRLPQRSPNCEIVSSPDRLWNPAMQPAGCAAIPAPCHLLSFHCHAVSVLNATETAAPMVEHIFWIDIQGAFCGSAQCHAVVCACLHTFAHMILRSFRWHSSFLGSSNDQSGQQSASVCCGRLPVRESSGVQRWNQSQNVRRWLWAWQLSMSKLIPLSLCVPHGFFATLQGLRLRLHSGSYAAPI